MEHHSWKITRSHLLETKQDQKRNLVQRSQQMFISSKKTHSCTPNPAAGSLRHKCYDPGTPATTQPCNFLLVFLNHVTMILPSNVLFPFSNKTGRQHFRKESAPRYHRRRQRWYIYISISIYTYTQSQRYTQLRWKNIMFFPTKQHKH